MKTWCLLACVCLAIALLPESVTAKKKNKNKCKGENEKLLLCGSDCQQTCKTLNQDIADCSDECQCGCFCVQGFVRNDCGECIPASQCPPESCPVNEEPSVCVGCANCIPDPECDDGDDDCRVGCECKFDYFRLPNGTCVKDEFCPPVTCPVNETITNCERNCDRCEDKDQPCGTKKPCERDCHCLEGYARNSEGRCVLIADCDDEDSRRRRRRNASFFELF